MTYQEVEDLIDTRQVSAVIKWIDEGGDPNLGIEENRFPLILDIIDEFYEVPDDPSFLRLLEHFLLKGALLNIPKKEVPIPLFEAVQAKCNKAVELFIAHKANVNVISHKGEYPTYTPLLIAVENEDLKCVKLLAKLTNMEMMHLTGGYQVSSALGCACLHFNAPIIEELLKNGANPYFEEWDSNNDYSMNLHLNDRTLAQQLQLDELIRKFSKYKI
ncbi:MAG: ankyrin repeat protein [Crocinitomix sp.]|jgi:ankyrin repeat protein